MYRINSFNMNLAYVERFWYSDGNTVCHSMEILFLK